MAKEELKKEVEEYLHKNYCCKGSYCGFNAECKEGIRIRCSEFEILEKHIINFAEPRENQIQIDAEQIRALQKQNGELTDELTKKADTNHRLVEQLAKMSEENAGLKCECRRCVYTDSPCVYGDYLMNDGHCSHFRDVFDENAELTAELKQTEKAKVVERFEAYGQCRDSRRIAELESQIDENRELKILISSLVYEINQIWDINEMNDDLRRCAEKIDREVQLSKMAEDNRVVISALGFAIVPPNPKLDVKGIKEK